MKKRNSGMKKLFAVFMAAAMSCGGAACGGGPVEQVEGIAGTITLNYFLSGYGDEWIRAVVDDYTKNVNSSAKIELKSNGANADMLDKIKAGTGDDMYIANANCFELSDFLMPLDDVLDMTVYDETDEKVRDRVGADKIEYYLEDGHLYQFPQNQKYGYTWIYNKTVLDEAFGSEEAYHLPRTTDEFLKMGDDLYGKGVFLSATAIGNGARSDQDYLEKAWNAWFGQMLGNEAHAKFYDGMYLDDDGEWVRDPDSSDNLFNRNHTAVEAVYALADKLCVSINTAQKKGETKTVQYLHSNSTGMQYKDLDVLFYGGQLSGRTFPRYAFIYSGAWLERETSSYDAIGVVDMSANEVYPMKTPVISAITWRTPTIADDATLAAVVDYVDGVTTEKPTGVSDDDVEIVREARNMENEASSETILITKNTRYPDLCKDFLRYLVSDRAQQVAARACSGVPILPYGYEPTDEDMGFEISDFIKEYERLSRDNVIVNIRYYNQVFTRKCNMSWFGDTSVIGSNTLAKVLYSNEKAPAVSEIVAKSISKFNPRWKDAVRETEAALGTAD